MTGAEPQPEQPPTQPQGPRPTSKSDIPVDNRRAVAHWMKNNVEVYQGMNLERMVEEMGHEGSTAQDLYHMYSEEAKSSTTEYVKNQREALQKSLSSAKKAREKAFTPENLPAYNPARLYTGQEREVIRKKERVDKLFGWAIGKNHAKKFKEGLEGVVKQRYHTVIREMKAEYRNNIIEEARLAVEESEQGMKSLNKQLNNYIKDLATCSKEAHKYQLDWANAEERLVEIENEKAEANRELNEAIAESKPVAKITKRLELLSSEKINYEMAKATIETKTTILEERYVATKALVGQLNPVLGEAMKEHKRFYRQSAQLEFWMDSPLSKYLNANTTGRFQATYERNENVLSHLKEEHGHLMDGMKYRTGNPDFDTEEPGSIDERLARVQDNTSIMNREAEVRAEQVPQVLEAIATAEIPYL